MGFLRDVFGPSKAEVWEQLSNEIGGDFIQRGLFKADRVDVRVKEWTITLDTFTVSNGKSSSTFTRMRAPYVNPDGFRFKVYREGLFSGLGKALGMQDIQVGYEEFDEKFVIKGNDEEKVIRLFENEKIRSLLEAQPYIHFEVKDDEGWFGGQFPEGVDELYFQVGGVIKDIERLKNLFQLFAEVLDELCRIGSAYGEDPQVELK